MNKALLVGLTAAATLGVSTGAVIALDNIPATKDKIDISINNTDIVGNGVQEAQKKQEELVKLNAELTAQKDFNTATSNALKVEKQNVATLTAKVSTLTSEVENKSTQVVELENQVSANNERIAELEASELEKTEEIESLQNDNLNLNTQISTLNSEVESKATHITELENQITANNERIAELEASEEDKTEEINLLKSQNADLNSEKEVLADEVSGLSSQVLELENQQVENNQRIAELEASEQEKIEEIEALNNQNSTLNAQIISLNSDIESKTSEIATLNAEITQKDQNIANLESSLAESNATITELQSKVDEYSELLSNYIVVTYNVDGVETMQIQDINSVADFPEPQKEGYYFLGWTKTNTGFISTLSEEKTFSENITLYARFGTLTLDDFKTKVVLPNGDYLCAYGLDNNAPGFWYYTTATDSFHNINRFGFSWELMESFEENSFFFVSKSSNYSKGICDYNFTTNDLVCRGTLSYRNGQARVMQDGTVLFENLDKCGLYDLTIRDFVWEQTLGSTVQDYLDLTSGRTIIITNYALFLYDIDTKGLIKLTDGSYLTNNYTMSNGCVIFYSSGSATALRKYDDTTKTIESFSNVNINGSIVDVKNCKPIEEYSENVLLLKNISTNKYYLFNTTDNSFELLESDPWLSGYTLESFDKTAKVSDIYYLGSIDSSEELYLFDTASMKSKLLGNYMAKDFLCVDMVIDDNSALVRTVDQSDDEPVHFYYLNISDLNNIKFNLITSGYDQVNFVILDNGNLLYATLFTYEVKVYNFETDNNVWSYTVDQSGDPVTGFTKIDDNSYKVHIMDGTYYTFNITDDGYTCTKE